MTYDPYAVLRARPHVTVVWDVDMPERGRWYDRLQTMLVRQGLTQAERRCVVAHEIRHMERGDTSCTPKVHHEAARDLISLEELADALVWCLGYEEVAEHLHVDARTARARINTLTQDEKDYIEGRIAAKGDAA
jgi:hypothetical protein